MTTPLTNEDLLAADEALDTLLKKQWDRYRELTAAGQSARNDEEWLWRVEQCEEALRNAQHVRRVVCGG